MYVSAACFFFFWIDGKRSVFIVNFLDHFQEKAGWKAWKGNRHRKHDVLMGLYIQLVSCFRGAKAEPHQNITATVAVCLSMHLHMIFSYI
jgi:hypothetical protein